MTGTRIVTWLKANGWALNLLFILIGGYFVGGTVNSVVAKTVRVVPTAAAGSQRPVTTSASASKKPEYVSMAPRNLLGAKRENLKPVVEEAATTDEPQLGNDFDENHLKDCTLPASLRATLVADGNPEWSIAVLYNNSSREPEVYSVNEGNNQITNDATLIEIRSREIIVRRSDHFERCMAEGEGKPMVAMAPREEAPGEPPAEATGDDAITKTGEDSYTISRDYLQDNVLNNLSFIATQARVVPSFKNGKPNGFKLFSIKPQSIYSKLGLQNGDVIHKINGYEMSSPDKALEIYQKLKDASNISVELTRRGQSKSMSVGIQ